MGLNASVEMGQLYAMGDQNRAEVHRQNVFAGQAARYGELQAASQQYGMGLNASVEMGQLYAMGDANREEVRRADVLANQQRQYEQLKEQSLIRPYDPYLSEGRGGPPPIPYVSDEEEAARKWGGMGSGFGKYLAAHMAIAGIAAIGKGITEAHDYAGELAMAGGRPQDEFETYVKHQQNTRDIVNSVPYIGQLGLFMTDMRDRALGNDTMGDLDRMQKMQQQNEAGQTARNELASGVMAYKWDVGTRYDSLAKESRASEMAQIERRKAFAKERTDELERVKQEDLKKGGMSDWEEDTDKSTLHMFGTLFSSNIRSYEGRMEIRHPLTPDEIAAKNAAKYVGIRDTKGAEELASEKIYELDQADIQFRRQMELQALRGEAAVTGAAARGDTIATKILNLTTEETIAKQTAQQAVTAAASLGLFQTATNGVGSQGWASSMVALKAAMDKQELINKDYDEKHNLLNREVAYMKINVANTADEAMASGQAAVLKAQGNEYAAQKITLASGIRTAQRAVAMDVASYMVYGVAPTEMSAHLAQLSEAEQLETARQEQEKRDVGQRLRTLAIQTQFSGQGLIAAEQFTSRQFGASRTTSMIAEIQEQALMGASAMEYEGRLDVKQAMAKAQVAGLKLTEYQVQHRYDRGYGEVRDVYQTKKEGYTQTNGMLDTTAIVAAIEKVITVINAAGGGGMPLLNMGP